MELRSDAVAISLLVFVNHFLCHFEFFGETQRDKEQLLVDNVFPNELDILQSHYFYKSIAYNDNLVNLAPSSLAFGEVPFIDLIMRLHCQVHCLNTIKLTCHPSGANVV